MGECSQLLHLEGGSLSEVLKVALQLPRVHVKELGKRYQVTPPPKIADNSGFAASSQSLIIRCLM